MHPIVLSGKIIFTFVFLIAGLGINPYWFSFVASEEQAHTQAEQAPISPSPQIATTKTTTTKTPTPQQPSASPSQPSITSALHPQKLYPVVEVVDGDTVKVEIEGEVETLRLIGIDTPETKDPRKPVECFGVEASNKAKEILEGNKVSLEEDTSQGQRDKYGRLLVYVWTEGGVNFNQYMIKEGYAYEYTYDTPYKYQEAFKEAQKQAQEQGKGLWNVTTCNGERGEAPKPTATPKPQPTATPQKQVQNQSCSCSLTCGKIATCSEAYRLLNTCGCGRLDKDKDGIPCESLCGG